MDPGVLAPPCSAQREHLCSQGNANVPLHLGYSTVTQKESRSNRATRLEPPENEAGRKLHRERWEASSYSSSGEFDDAVLRERNSLLSGKRKREAQTGTIREPGRNDEFFCQQDGSKVPGTFTRRLSALPGSSMCPDQRRDQAAALMCAPGKQTGRW